MHLRDICLIYHEPLQCQISRLLYQGGVVSISGVCVYLLLCLDYWFIISRWNGEHLRCVCLFIAMSGLLVLLKGKHLVCITVTNLGVVRGQDHTNNEQTQSVDGIIWFNMFLVHRYQINIIPVTTGDFTHTLHKYDVLPEYTKNTRSYTMTYTGHDRRLYN